VDLPCEAPSFSKICQGLTDSAGRGPSTKPELLPLKRGSVVRALEAGNIPIVPVVVGNAAHVFNVPKRTFNPGMINVKVLPPINTELKGDESKDAAISGLLSEMRQMMLETLEKISA